MYSVTLMSVCKIIFFNLHLTVHMKPCVSDRTVPLPNWNVLFNSLANAAHVTEWFNSFKAAGALVSLGTSCKSCWSPPSSFSLVLPPNHQNSSTDTKQLKLTSSGFSKVTSSWRERRRRWWCLHHCSCCPPTTAAAATTTATCQPASALSSHPQPHKQ